MHSVSKDTVSDTYFAFVDQVSTCLSASLDRISDLVNALAASRWQQDPDFDKRGLHIGLRLNDKHDAKPEIAVFDHPDKGLVSITQADLEYLISGDSSFASHVSRLISELLIRGAIEHGVCVDE